MYVCYRAPMYVFVMKSLLYRTEKSKLWNVQGRVETCVLTVLLPVNGNIAFVKVKMMLSHHNWIIVRDYQNGWGGSSEATCLLDGLYEDKALSPQA